VLGSSISSLKTLNDTASTSRVLNLSHVCARFKQDNAYQERPFFNDSNLNRAIFVKHRLRSDEVVLMPLSQPIATKIVFPFDATFLKSGGRSIFVGQTGFIQAMEAFLGPPTAATQQDLDLLALLETLPSLDPFLLKEHLSRHNRRPADCYFDISMADMARMRRFVSDQIGDLIALAFGGAQGGIDAGRVASLADALMATDAGDRLDPLRITLGLDGQAFHDGVFSWKGFLYYKWQFGETAKGLNRVLGELDAVKFDDNPPTEAVAAIAKQRRKLRAAIVSAARECTAILTLYDDAFADLLDRGKAAAFRKFLLEAPRLFVRLGTCMGSISHIESHWANCFPKGTRLSCHSIEFSFLLSDFQQSLQPETALHLSWS
jgi:hypothetical protein